MHICVPHITTGHTLEPWALFIWLSTFFNMFTYFLLLLQKYHKRPTPKALLCFRFGYCIRIRNRYYKFIASEISLKKSCSSAMEIRASSAMSIFSLPNILCILVRVVLIFSAKSVTVTSLLFNTSRMRCPICILLSANCFCVCIKKAWIYSCLTSRVTTPSHLNKSFHAVIHTTFNN